MTLEQNPKQDTVTSPAQVAVSDDSTVGTTLIDHRTVIDQSMMASYYVPVQQKGWCFETQHESRAVDGGGQMKLHDDGDRERMRVGGYRSQP